MTKKVLKKAVTSILDQPFAENILPSFLFSKKVKKIIGKIGNNTAPQLSKSDKIRKAETSIIKQFLNFSYSKEFLSNSPFRATLTPDLNGVQVLRGVPVDQSSNQPPTNLLRGSRAAQHTKQNHEDQGVVSLLNKRDTSRSTVVDQSPIPHVLFSIDQIRNEIVSKRTQTKTYSEFKSQLLEIKKIRILYGNISKRDLEKTVARMKTFSSTAGENLLVILETRLDVALQRCGFFATIQASRQSIIHGKIKVNFRYITFPGYLLKAGDIIKVIDNKLKSLQDPLLTPPAGGSEHNSLQNSVIWTKHASTSSIEKDENEDFNTIKYTPISNLITNKALSPKTKLLERNTAVLNNRSTLTPDLNGVQVLRGVPVDHSSNQVNNSSLTRLGLDLKNTCTNYKEKASKNVFLIRETPNFNTNEWRFSVSPRMVYSLLQLQSHVLYSQYQETALTTRSTLTPLRGVPVDYSSNPSISVNQLSTFLDNKQRGQKQHPNTFNSPFLQSKIEWPLLLCQHLLSSLFRSTLTPRRGVPVDHSSIQKAYALEVNSASILKSSPPQKQKNRGKSVLLAHNLMQTYYFKRGLLPDALTKLCCNSSQQSFVNIINTITQYISLKEQQGDMRIESKKATCSLFDEKVLCLACALHKMVYYGVITRQENRPTSLTPGPERSSGKQGNPPAGGVRSGHSPNQKGGLTKLASTNAIKHKQAQKQEASTNVFDCNGGRKYTLLRNASLLVFCFWLLVRRCFTPYALQKQAYSLHKNKTFFRHQRSLSQKNTKPLHFEVSYQSHCAVFLYSPQRIYLPVVIDLGLITKAFKKT